MGEPNDYRSRRGWSESEGIHLATRAGINAFITRVRLSFKESRVFLIIARNVDRTLFMSFQK